MPLAWFFSKKMQNQIVGVFLFLSLCQPYRIQSISKATHTEKTYLYNNAYTHTAPLGLGSNYRKLVLGLCAQFNVWRSLPPSCPCPHCNLKVRIQERIFSWSGLWCPPRAHRRPPSSSLHNGTWLGAGQSVRLSQCGSDTYDWPCTKMRRSQLPCFLRRSSRTTTWPAIIPCNENQSHFIGSLCVRTSCS